MLNCDEMMEMFHYMEDKNIILSIDLADGKHASAGDERNYPGMSATKNRYRTFSVWLQLLIGRNK